MMIWLVDTAIYTGLLIVLVLALRRPVARWFGPQAAYALWALPLLRLIMPPLVLPASFAPLHPVSVMPAGALEQAGEIGGGIGVWLLALWLGGAAALLAGRALSYFPMRQELLIDAQVVGQSGTIRLVETATVSAPIAFGVSDKIVALPLGFMAQADYATRDMAIAHELAHHRGHDLLANIAAQVLLALHWFNPLAWLGWRAMRRDQEAACDARVMQGAGWQDRAAYAHMIAGFAAGPRLSLGAQMACPVLGDKSILHRLRILGREEVSVGRRHIGRAVMALALMALPATASISYVSAVKPMAAPAPAVQEMPLAMIEKPTSTPPVEADDTAPMHQSLDSPPELQTKPRLAVATPKAAEPLATTPEINLPEINLNAPAPALAATAPRMVMVQWAVNVRQQGQQVVLQRVVSYATVIGCPAVPPQSNAAHADEALPEVNTAQANCPAPQQV